MPVYHHAALRSYDGSAFVARVNAEPCRAWGNSSIPCMHLVQAGPMTVQGGSIIFFIGSAADLEKEIGTLVHEH